MRRNEDPVGPVDIFTERHEAKYIIPVHLVPEIRAYIKPFCCRDPHGVGDLPEYTVNTMQLDGPGVPLHYAKEHEAFHRFKLRVRTYGDPVGQFPVFTEVKRKSGGMVIKSRTVIPFADWSQELVRSSRVTLPFRSEREAHAFIEFKGLVMMIGAEPKAQIRYVRESYIGRSDHYARVTFDRRLEYQPCRSWTDWGRSGRWIAMDSALQQYKQFSFSGVVLELKTLYDAPSWMINLVHDFDLTRIGNCKYSTAVWSEALFQGEGAEAPFKPDVLGFG